jgi:hypothetical protein
MTPLPPWANGPFELLVHAEGHLRNGEDFDRRIALISFDNAIEVAITTYLTLNPIQRGGRSYPKADIDKWLNNYHTRLDFLDAELLTRKIPWLVDKAYIIWAHDHRNEQYHGGHKGTPEKNVLKITRDAALWVFSLLFDLVEVEAVLAKGILDSAPPPAPVSDQKFDLAIDGLYGVVEVGEQKYYVSDVLFSVDYAAYRDLGGRLCATGEDASTETSDKKS